MSDREHGPTRTRTAPRHGCPTRRFAGWTAAGTTDWPGRVSATITLGGCSFACPYCDEPSLREPAGRDSDWEPFIAHLGTRVGWIDGVVITGGEPTDDPDLPALLAALGERGWAVRLETNGANPQVLRHVAAEGLVSQVALDYKAPLDRYDALTGSSGAAEAVAESIVVLRDSGTDHEYRTTLFPGAVTLHDLELMAETLAGGRLWALQQYRPGGNLDRRASLIEPFAAQAVRETAVECRRHIPTVLRGFGTA